jgi:uncharacterized membrane protein
MALVGGFLVPVLLSTGRDQYAVLFTYMGILDLGVLAVVMVRRWPWIGSLAYVARRHSCRRLPAPQCRAREQVPR